MISVPGGKYTLGSAASDKDAEVDETPAKTVEISDFWMAETEVTYDLFQLFLDETKILVHTSMASRVPANRISILHLGWER